MRPWFDSCSNHVPETGPDGCEVGEMICLTAGEWVLAIVVGVVVGLAVRGLFCEMSGRR